MSALFCQRTSALDPNQNTFSFLSFAFLLICTHSDDEFHFLSLFTNKIDDILFFNINKRATGQLRSIANAH